jgi:hypothetical protein
MVGRSGTQNPKGAMTVLQWIGNLYDVEHLEEKKQKNFSRHGHECLTSSPQSQERHRYALSPPPTKPETLNMSPQYDVPSQIKYPCTFHQASLPLPHHLARYITHQEIKFFVPPINSCRHQNKS